MINRSAKNKVERLLQVFPAVVVLGSRQCGKSTLVKMISADRDDVLYVDLQSRYQRMQLADPVLFFEHNADKLICLDEIQLLPDLFSYLRTEIDRERRPGRFILLGSASRDLLQHTTESLAGRVGLIDLTPFLLPEVASYDDFDLSSFWLRGGYPDSYLAMDDEASALWRENYIRTYIERDIPQLGFAIAATKMLRLLTMLCHEHGSMINYSKLASSMDLTAPTIRHYVDILEETYIVRVLQPWYKNIRKRLVKTPRVYIRDTGLLHQVLGITDYNHLLGHPIIGFSWEGMVVENVCSIVRGATCSFYRSLDGMEEMDLVVEWLNRRVAIECKSSVEPQLSDGFYKALKTLDIHETYVVCPIDDIFPLREDIQVCGLKQLCELLQD
ncbi:MAG: ATP-binding protein [Paludibacteraceae bacterium]|nr:ATP-binding protein [Paludibacteraceae bacterium]